MFAHGPSCLRGPFSRARDWWAAATEGQTSEPSTTDAVHMFQSENLSGDDRPFRAELVERVRRALAEGTYETLDKLDLALDRLMRRLDDE